MRKQVLIASTLLCSTLITQAATLQNLIVQQKNGAQTTYTLSTVRKINFTGSTMSVVKTDATQADFTLSNVQNLQFGSSTTAIKEASNAGLKGYPNPVKDAFNVAGISKVENIALYNISGNELPLSYSQKTNGIQINTASLPQGLYLLRVNNQTIKIQKQ